MARPGLSFEEVVTAAEKIINQGLKPTISRIREELGNRGSTTTISRHLKDWRSGKKVSESMAASKPEITPMQQVESKPTEVITKPTNQVMIKKKKSMSAFTYSTERPALKIAEVRSPDIERPEYKAEPLDQLEHMDKGKLKIKVLQLETLLAKEQSRRESAELMARDMREYAEILKEEVGKRMDDMERSYERTINELRAEARQLKMNAATDLKFYREALEKANAKLGELLAKKP